jgi:serine/threonine kinase 32
MKAVANIIQERRLLEEVSILDNDIFTSHSFNRQIDHPFVVNLRYAFQDDENCFFVLDLMLGGDLRCMLPSLFSASSLSRFDPFSSPRTVRLVARGYSTLLRRRNSFSSSLPSWAKNHAPVCIIRSRISLPLHNYLTSDLKPDNILLDERGHAHLTDFNIAVHFSERRMLTGIAGSMAYMAPEILAKRGYTYPIDWWSLGVCAYELLFGRRPFRGKTNTDLTYSISKDSLRFPDDADKKCSRAGMMALKGVSGSCRLPSCADFRAVLGTRSF